MCRYPEDAARTAYTGKFFAAINAVSAIVQFGGVTVMLRQLGLSRMMLVLPIGVTVCSAVLVLNASLAAAALLQLVFKV